MQITINIEELIDKLSDMIDNDYITARLEVSDSNGHTQLNLVATGIGKEDECDFGYIEESDEVFY